MNSSMLLELPVVRVIVNDSHSLIEGDTGGSSQDFYSFNLRGSHRDDGTIRQNLEFFC